MSKFEDYCWRDLIPQQTLDLYAQYERDLHVGPNPALLVVDLYELAYQGGPREIPEIAADYPSSCGINAHNAIPDTQRLLSAARGAGVPVFYSTSEIRSDSRLDRVRATNRRSGAERTEADYAIRPELAPASGEVLIRKQRASVFYGTPLLAHLVQLGVRSLIVIGQSTSGCVRATVVDAFSNGFHVCVVEECCFDRSPMSHKVNLFDMHHKYADVMHVDAVIEAL
jgi:nicotinamidase-related amidase